LTLLTTCFETLTLALASAPPTASALAIAPGATGPAPLAAASPLALLIPGLPLLGTLLMLLCACLKVRTKLPAIITVGVLGAAFGVTLYTFLTHTAGPSVAHAFTWFDLTFTADGGKPAHFVANFALYIDSLTLLWMLFVTGLATLIALYASEYMSHDVGPGYIRFFGAFNLFVVSMTFLVMGDNLLLLFLGWEGVGLCSYLLIGYFYKKPPAVAAAKKAFIINRIGDLGLLLGILTTFVVFGSIEYRTIFWYIEQGITASGAPLAQHWAVWVIPALLTCGAFGKSAQLFFYVWLPDAMEGPTPVSALIHAATMVTAGVYLIARMYPLFAADPNLYVLTIVGWSGAITAFWAATIEMAIFDIKRVMGYSTISQLGFMFAGLGLLSPVGASFHTFTHAFFKATLFLGVGAVMHGFGGQLDLRRLSGVAWMRGFGLVGVAMLIGSINLSGVPFTAGYFSKDIILADAFALPPGQIWGSSIVAWLLLITAGMTAYYTFRTYFRVYAGPKEFVPGDDAELLDLGRHPKGTSLDAWHAQHSHGHGHGDAHGHGHGHGHGTDTAAAHRVDFDPTSEEFDPHPPGAAMKLSIALCMVLAIAAAGLYFIGPKGGWVAGMIADSSAKLPAALSADHAAGHAAGDAGHGAASAAAHAVAHGTIFGYDPHKAMYYISAGVGFIGIFIAAVLHGPRGWQGLFVGSRTQARVSVADRLVPLFGPITKLARNKWYVDEIYNAIIRIPLLVLSHLLHFIDKLLVDKLLVDGLGSLPRATGEGLRESQSGVLNAYAVSMALGAAGIVLVGVLILL
jgi:NADH-quinone oxidoreductase subunit L